MRKSYEVILWEKEGVEYQVKHGNVKGKLLSDYLRTSAEIKQKVFFRWIERLAGQLDAAQKYRKGLGYKYLNPYSVMISETGEIYLLDLEAQSNREVIRFMQSRSVRHFFSETRSEMKDWAKVRQNLYAFGQLLRFMEAEAQVSPGFTRRQKRRLSAIIEKCTGEKKNIRTVIFAARRYEAFSQVQKDIGKIPAKADKERENKEQEKAQSNGKKKTDRAKRKKETTNACRKRKRTVYAIGGIGMTIVLYAVGTGELGDFMRSEKSLEAVSKVQPGQGAGERSKLQTESEKSKGDGTDNMTDAASDSREGNHLKDSKGISEEISADGDLYTLLLNNSKKDNLTVIEQGEARYRELLYCLALAYEREEKTEKALHMYRELCSVEEVSERLETIYKKRIRLEEKMNYNRALQTAKEATEKVEDSEILAELYLEMYTRYGEEAEKEYREQAEKLQRVFPYMKKGTDMEVKKGGED